MITNEVTESLAAQVIHHRLSGTSVADVMAVIHSYLPHEGWEAMTGSEQMMVEAQVLKAVRGAAELGYWAVPMGLDGLEPSADAVTLNAVFEEGEPSERELPLVRVHLAFRPDMPLDTRRGFLMELGELINGDIG